MDANGLFIMANRAVAESYGMKPEELVGKRHIDLATVPEEAERSLRDDREVIKTGKAKFIPDGVYTDKNHVKHWLQTTKVPFDHHGETAVLINAVDITERRKIEQELSFERNLLETLMNTSPDLIYFKDTDSRFTGASKALTDRFGLDHPSQAVGKTDFDFFGEEHAHQAFQDEQEIIRTGKPLVGFVERETWPDGRETWVSTTKVPLRNAEGKIVGVYGMSRDITERKHADERLRAYAAKLDKANDELKRFTYIVSHDLRAPLVNLKGFTTELTASMKLIAPIINEILPRMKEDARRTVTTAFDEDIPEALEFINSSVNRMDAFINALLSLSRLGYRKLEFEPVDLNEVVEATLRTLAHQIEGQQARIIVGKLPKVIADKVSMEQIMANLLHNAVIYLEPDRRGRIHVSGEDLKDEVIIKVSDNGRGIAEKDMDKVFVPFRRAGKPNTKGEGMGLSYVQALVRRHNGSIQCESQLGVGTTFTFNIPKSPQKEPTNV
jgi:PAS domain S-box-containing protein